MIESIFKVMNDAIQFVVGKSMEKSNSAKEHWKTLSISQTTK